MLIVEVMNEARSSTVDSVHIAFGRNAMCVWHTQILLPTSGMLIKGPSQGPVGFNRAFIPLCSIVSKDIKISVRLALIHDKQISSAQSLQT